LFIQNVYNNIFQCFFNFITSTLWFTKTCRDVIYNKQIIANCSRSVPVKEFRKSVNNWQRYGQKYSATFFMEHSV